jgi:hypothetical protein
MDDGAGSGVRLDVESIRKALFEGSSPMAATRREGEDLERKEVIIVGNGNVVFVCGTIRET